VHAKNGICCGWSGGFRLVQLVGPARAIELMSSSRLVSQPEAERLGLCELRADSLDAALDFVRAHAIESGRTSAAIKTLVSSATCGGPAAAGSVELALQLECQLFAATWGRAAHLRALERNAKHGGGGGGASK
jgi:enoyl-CoA hydratase/carnithine racemase